MSRRWSSAYRALFRCLFLGFIFVAVLRWHVWFPPQASLRTVAQLRSFLQNRLGLHAALTMEHDTHPIDLFFMRDPLARTRVMALCRCPERIGDWKGVVLVERLNPTGENLPFLDGWEGCSLQLGPFLFFGDPALLAEIETALRSQQEKLQG
jgi:hypothetical protein